VATAPPTPRQTPASCGVLHPRRAFDAGTEVHLSSRPSGARPRPRCRASGHRPASRAFVQYFRPARSRQSKLSPLPPGSVRVLRRFRVDQKLVGDLRIGIDLRQILRPAMPMAFMTGRPVRARTSPRVRGFQTMKLQHVERHRRPSAHRASRHRHRPSARPWPGRGRQHGQFPRGLERHVPRRFLEENQTHVGARRPRRPQTRPRAGQPAEFHRNGHGAPSARRFGVLDKRQDLVAALVLLAAQGLDLALQLLRLAMVGLAAAR
jgi:hypothetical protein